MKKFLNITIILLLMVLFTNRVYAETGNACRGSVTIRETHEAQTAKFKAVLPMCDTEDGLIFDGYQEYETKETYPEARDMGRAQVEAYYRSLDNKEIGVTSVPRCDNKIAYIKNTFSIKVTKKAEAIDYEKKKEEVWKCYDICSNANEFKCKDDDHKDYCQWYDGKSPVPLVNANMSGLTRTSAISGSVIEPQCLKIQDKCGWEETGRLVNDTDRPIMGCKLSDGYAASNSSVDPDKKWHYDPSEPEETACSVTDKIDAYNCVDDNYYYDEEETDEEKKCKPIKNDDDRAAKIEQVNTVSKDPDIRARTAKGVCKRKFILKPVKIRPGDRYIVIDDRGTTLDEYLRRQNEMNYICHEPTSWFWFNCPKYHCEATAKTISACTPTFKVEGTNIPAYCVNAGEGFADIGEHTAGYKLDLDFDASACESSHSTVECGYASILIEGKAKNLDYKVIELALRLWSVHTGQSGYDSGVGLSLATGENCNQGAWYMSKNGVLYNVYKQTYKFAMKDFFEETWEKELTPRNVSGFTYACNSFPKERKSLGNGKYIDELTGRDPKYAVACDPTNNTLQLAIGLLIQTINGNKDMLDHVKEFFGGIVEAEPEYATMELPGEDGHNRVVITHVDEQHYRDLTFWGERRTQENVEVDCDTLEPDDPHYDEIAPYCQMRVVILGPDGEVIEEGDVTKCEKDIGCTYVTRGRYSLCDIDTDPLYIQPEKIIVVYKRPIKSGTVKRFISCAGNQNQFLYALDYEGDVQTTELPVEYGEEYIDSISFRTDEAYKAFETNSYHCIGEDYGYCYINNDSAVKVETQTTCNNDFSNYGGSFKSSIKDPSLKCIVHANDATTKASYEYTSYFGLNPNICRVFCSDEVEYVIADKVKTISGRPFVYDIRASSVNLKNSDKLLSSFIREKRTCVSEIYYDLPFPLQSLINLKRTYGLTDRELPLGSDWKRLYRVLVEKGTRENHRGENINQILYDLYNCNFYTARANGNFYIENDDESVGVITRPTTYEEGKTAREIILSTYKKSNNYGLVSCSESNNLNSCIAHNNISFPFGGTPDGQDITMQTVGYEDARNNVYSSFFGGIKYCSGEDCFKYISTEGKSGTELENIDRSNYTYPSRGDRKSSEVRLSGYTHLTNNAFRYPINDYAYFTVTVELGFYNSSQLWYEPITGDVLNGGHLDDRGITNHDSYMRVEPFNFTTSIYAYNMTDNNGNRICNKVTDRSTGTEWNRCKIEQTFGNVSTFFRKNTSDKFSYAVRENRTFGCYVDIDKPTVVDCNDADKCVRYRNADAGNLFPNNIEIPTNWNNTTGQRAIEYIQNNSQHMAFNEDLLEYSITLNPEQIKNIQEESHTGYVDEDMDLSSCSVVNVEDGVQIYTNCVSNFLNELRTASAEGDSSKGTLNYDVRYDFNSKSRRERLPNQCFRDGESDRFTTSHCLY